MEFSPANNIVKLCLQGMGLEEKGKPEEAALVFLEAWNQATNDFEQFLAAHYLARHQKDTAGRLEWLQKGLQFALKIDDATVASALPSLYTNIAQCYEQLEEPAMAQKNNELAAAANRDIADKGPFYHGTRADLQVGDFLTAGRMSNYHAEVLMNHIYFTALINGAGLAAALAKGDGAQRIYIVTPTGSFEHDPNVTDKKFPGNPTRSYRTREPLKITGEITDWQKLSDEELAQWRERLANSKGAIIN